MACVASQEMRPGCGMRSDPGQKGGGWLAAEKGKLALFNNIPHNSGEKMQARAGSKGAMKISSAIILVPQSSL